MKKIIAYECEFCGKILKTKAHGYYCYFDPKHKACVTCNNLDTDGKAYICTKNYTTPFLKSLRNCPEYKNGVSFFN